MSTDLKNPKTCPFCGDDEVGELPDHLREDCPETPARAG